jgi:hypothetical protein
MMKVRNTHGGELVFTPEDLAKALGHQAASLREAEVQMKDGKIEALRIYFEYVIATKGIPKAVTHYSASVSKPDLE